MMKRNQILLFILTIKSILIMIVIQSGLIGLGPDEAQYWTWSTELDWGYYSKPPGIAWQIWLGTHLFGHTELGVRFGSIVIGFMIPLAVYELARTCQLSDRTSFWAGLMMALSPLGVLASFLATTDGGMVLFWTLACIAFISRNYFLLGLAVLCGALFKWPIYIIWVFILLFQGINLPLLGGIFISLLGLFPTILWNSTHDWATFRHVYKTMIGGHPSEIGTQVFQGNFFDFIGAQAGLMSPILFILLITAFFFLVRNPRKVPRDLLFCGGMSITLLFFYALLAIFQKIQGNWCVFAYPSGIVFLSWYACKQMQKGIFWLQVGLVTSLVMVAVLLITPLVNLPTPFRHNLGWKELRSVITEIGYDPERHFLFGDKYQMASILSFYSPEKAYFFNIHGERKNQFSYWPGMADKEVGNTGFFVKVENSPRLEKYLKEQKEKDISLLRPYFEHVEDLGIYPLVTHGTQILKAAIIFQCQNYLGDLPKDPEKY